MALIAVLAIALAGCSDGGKSGIEFGEGEMPSTVPDDFPFPEQGVIGTTLVDHDNAVTEVSARIPAGVKIVAQYFDQNLVNRGYVLESSSGSDASWEISLRRDELRGTIDLAAQGTVTVVTLRFDNG